MIPGGFMQSGQGAAVTPSSSEKTKAVFTRINTERNGKSGAKQGEKV